MTDSYKELTKDTSKYIGELKQLAPESMNGFYSLSSNAIKDGALSKKQKELMALSIGVTQRCGACIGFHVKTLISLGMTKEELAETLSLCVYMGGGPSLMYAAQAMKAFEEFS